MVKVEKEQNDIIKLNCISNHIKYKLSKHPIERQGLSDWLTKQYPIICCL